MSAAVEPPRDCPLCPRLVAYRRQNQLEHPDWWNGPAPSFGDPDARLLIVGLARRENLTVRQILSRLGGGRGHFEFAGTPEQVADTIVEWFSGGAADGFNIMAPELPAGLQTFIDQVLPILRRAGLFREEYEGATLREHYGLDVPPNQFHVSEGVAFAHV